ncbi:MAG: fibronectin type III domain-containing protein [Thermoguttaceae bacterium]
MFRYIRNKLLGAAKKQIRGNTARSSRQLRFEGLEVRQMMTTGLVTSMSSGPALSAVVAPAAPSFTATRTSATEVNLSWSTVSGASGYLVDEKILLDYTGPIFPMCIPAPRQIANLGSGSTGYSVTGLSPGTGYSFDVAAYNSAGTSWANYQNVNALSPPAAPSFTATTASSTQITLSWSTVSGASGYLVQQLVNGAWSQIASLGSSATSYAVTGLSPGTAYSFEVAACNSAGTTWASSQSATTTTESWRSIGHPAPRQSISTGGF